MSYDKDNEELASVCAFPRRLYAIVNNPENHTIINWNDKGDHFVIYNPNEFAEKILTRREFNSANYASFVRQLNMYDFHKVKNRFKEKSDTFYHRYFLKDRASLLKNVRRKINQIHLDNDDTSKSNIQTSSNLGIKRSSNSIIMNSSIAGYNNPSLSNERIDRDLRDRQERNDRQYLNQINNIKQEDQTCSNNFNCISNIYNFPQINEINHSFHPNNYNVNSLVNSNNNKLSSNYLSNNLREVNNINNSTANSNLNYSKSQIDSNNQLSLNTNNQEISNLTTNQKFLNKSKEKVGKKANKSLIHTLYTTFLKNVRNN
jgi:hypothetical protein